MLAGIIFGGIILPCVLIICVFLDERKKIKKLNESMYSSSRSKLNHTRISEEERAYSKTNHIQSTRGINATRLSTAKDALSQMENGYAKISHQVSPLSASIYKEDISDVRSNVEELVLEKWQNKAESILDEFISLYLLITDDVSFADIDKAHASKGKCLAKYDAYWAWTAKMHEENADFLRHLNLWNNAKTLFRERFENVAPQSDHSMLVWGESTNLSTRERIEKRLSDCIYTMQPEYKRKMKLRSLILKDIAQKTTVQRSEFLKTNYEGFIEKELLACYKGMVREGLIIEVKQGSRYFSSLTEKGQKKLASKNKSQVVSTKDAN